MRFDYYFYGLHLKSDWQLPYPREQAPSRKLSAHIELRRPAARSFSRVPRDLLHSREAFCYSALANGTYYLRWAGWWDFLVSARGERVIARPIGRRSLESFSHYLLSQVLSFALLRRGIESLHSTVVVIDGHAVGFLGDSGYGKSSLAAAFVKSGYRLMTDDLLVLQEDGNGFLAQPGLPRIKLFPEIAPTLLGRPVNGTRMNPKTSKIVIPLRANESCRAPVPLRGIYVLNSPATARPSRRVRIQRLSRRQAFLALLQNTFNSKMLDPDRLKRNFLFASSLAAKTPIRVLSYPRKWKSLAAVRDAVLRDLAR
jgi:hypothetical protein